MKKYLVQRINELEKQRDEIDDKISEAKTQDEYSLYSSKSLELARIIKELKKVLAMVE